LTLNASGGFTYTPAGGYVGADSFAYTATDGKATSSPASVVLNVTAPPVTGTTPSAPNNLVATSASDYSSISLTWQNTATNATSIQIERQGADGVWQIIATLSPTATSYTDTTVNWNQGYYYQVCAVNAAGVSAWSMRAWTWG
jgi:fibronectin type 3 domain-containing protein